MSHINREIKVIVESLKALSYNKGLYDGLVNKHESAIKSAKLIGNDYLVETSNDKLTELRTSLASINENMNIENSKLETLLEKL